MAKRKKKHNREDRENRVICRNVIPAELQRMDITEKDTRKRDNWRIRTLSEKKNIRAALCEVS